MFVAQIVDRTEQIQAELEVRQHRERLAQVSRLGTMGEMAAGIAHELNQPLTAIANYAQACLRMIDADAIETAELNEILGKISGQARRAGHVIEGLRSFVKKRAVSRKPTKMARVIRDVMMLAELDGRAHGVSITSDTQEDLPLVQADPIQLQQVILNLIRNGVDAMVGDDDRDGGVIVTTRLEAPDEICVSVEDDGSGIDESVASRLFDPFFTTKAEGMGMGLALSRSIVEAHGGRLNFTRKPSGGTIFTMTLPTLPEDG
jgi:C4-dicarboxylate-specific signal transduction histidine kinase